MTPTLISSRPHHVGRVLIIWVQTQAPTVFGPFMAARPSTEVINDYLVAHAAQLLASLVNVELYNALTMIAQDGSLATFPPLKYATLADIQTELRAFYSTATMLEAVMIGDYLNSRTDAVLRNLFGFTQPQVNTLRTNKLVPAATIAANVRASAGA